MVKCADGGGSVVESCGRAMPAVRCTIDTFRLEQIKPEVVKKNLITPKAQLIDPGVSHVGFKERHNPIPGGLTAAVLAADTHETNMGYSLPLEFLAEL